MIQSYHYVRRPQIDRRERVRTVPLIIRRIRQRTEYLRSRTSSMSVKVNIFINM